MRDQLLNLSAEIMRAKNHDYSGANGDPLSNFRLSTKINIPVSAGIALRIMDKHQRIRTFIAKGMLAVKGESVKDAVLDCINYTILLDAYWHGVTSSEMLYHFRAELEAEATAIGMTVQYPTDPRVLLDMLETTLCHDEDTVYLLNGYLALGEVLINE